MAMKPIGQTFAMFKGIAFAVLSLPCALAQAQPQSDAASTIDKAPSFEVAAIEPSKPEDQRRSLHSGSDRLDVENFTLRRLIRTANGMKSDSLRAGY